MPAEFDPKTAFTNRQRLLKICNDRGISAERLSALVRPMADLSQEEKEQMAAELIPVVQSGLYDSHPRHFYRSMRLSNQMRDLSITDNVSYGTVCPLVEKGLRYFHIPQKTIRQIITILSTEEHLWHMFHWITEQTLIPDANTCLATAKEIDRSVTK